MKKLLVTFIFSLILLAQAQDIIIGSGSTTGVYFPIATQMAARLESALGLEVEVWESRDDRGGGSVNNIRYIQDGNIQLALAQNDTSFYALQGEGISAFREPVDDIRGLAALYFEPVHVAARADADISSIADLAGKRVVVGGLGTGVQQSARQVLEAYGLDFSDLTAIEESPGRENIPYFVDGSVDAVFYTAGLGNTYIADLAEATDIVLLPVEAEQVQMLSTQYPYYLGFNIREGVYENVVETPTVTVLATLIADKDLDDDLVYDIMQAIFGDIDVLQGMNINLRRDFSYQRALRALPIPLHPGAERFYRNLGIIR